MHDRNETVLEALLADTLAERAARIPTTVTIERVRARLEERRTARRQARARRPLALLGVAAAVLLPTAAFVVGQRPSLEPVEAGGNEAIVRRSADGRWNVVGVSPDGRERALAAVPVPQENGRRRQRMVVSADGWLAITGTTGWEFREMRSPDRVVGSIVPFLASEVGQAWLGGDRFVTWNEAGEVVFLDPGAGAAARATLPTPYREVIAWTADGSAIVTEAGGGSPSGEVAERDLPHLLVQSLDGGVVETPLGDLDLAWTSASPGRVLGDPEWWRADGSRVRVCVTDGWNDCPGLPDGAVVVVSPEGARTTWYTDQLAPDDVVHAAVGERGVWLLLDRRTHGPEAVLAHLEAPGRIEEVAVWPHDLRGPAAGFITEISPDGSVVVVSAGDDLLVDVPSGRVTGLRGDFLGLGRSLTAVGSPGARVIPANPTTEAGSPVPGGPEVVAAAASDSLATGNGEATVAVLEDGPVAPGRYVVMPPVVGWAECPNWVPECPPEPSGARSLRFEISVPPGWEALADGTVIGRAGGGLNGPDGAGFVVGWTTPTAGLHADPCQLVPHLAPDIPVGPTVDEFVEAVVAHPSLEVSDPLDVELGGYRGRYVQLTVPSEISACVDWRPFEPGIYAHGPDNLWSIWAIDVDGLRMIVLTAEFPGTPAEVRADLRSMVESIRFLP